ncbi:hypothetical protein FA15DRAFT_78689 [Coprinopsis marcescibilis]|uniref:DUF6534 domain-containing protein n=1 Tax=Coprinopsis marcescibilis TaxID=230819 RepID=A0A5C3KMN4_COPMA|nr:hypothetical protein FA15DRAFT_78689 [Coprinopsis marcescibilis]
MPLLFGPMLIGVLLNTILYGILIMQMFIYWQRYKSDATWIRVFILFLFIAETVNTVLNAHMIYVPLIIQWGTQEAVTYFPMMLAADPLVTAIIAAPVQMFVGWRIRIISRSSWLLLLIWALALTGLGGGIWLSVTVTQIREFARKPELHWPALLWLLSSAIVDVVITISLVFHLSRRKTGFRGTDNSIDRIIRLTIQTGMVTTVFAILDVLCFLLLPRTTINFIWDFALSKLYTNALMSTLNARGSWGSHNIATTVTGSDGQFNLLFGGQTGLRTEQQSGDGADIEIAVVPSFNRFRLPGNDVNVSVSDLRLHEDSSGAYYAMKEGTFTAGTTAQSFKNFSSESAEIGDNGVAEDDWEKGDVGKIGLVMGEAVSHQGESVG